jgi:integrase
MNLPAHLRRSRHGIYYFRIVLPKALAKTVGRREVIRSLGTRCPRQAKRAAYLLWADILRRDGGDSMSTKRDRPPVQRMIIGRLRAGDVELEGIETSDDPAVMAQELAALEGIINRLNANVGSVNNTASSPPPESDRTSSVRPARPKSLGDAWKAYMATLSTASGSTKEGYTESFRLFSELLGGESRMLHDIGDTEILDYKDALPLVPAHAKKRKLIVGTINELKQHYPQYRTTAGALVDAKVISKQTADQHLIRVRTFLTWATKNKHRVGDNPLDGHKLATKGHSQRADPFLGDDLAKIFNPESLMRAERPTQYWTLLLSLYTGARLNELASLTLDDIVVEEDIRCFSIFHEPNVSPEEQARTGRTPKRTKNQASIRLVPLHPDLIELGLDDYIADLRSLGTNLLFPNAPLDSKGKRERRLSHDGNEYLKTVKVHRARVKVLHSFRSTVINKLAHGGLNQSLVYQWTGHTDDSVQGTHYLRTAPIKDLAPPAFAALVFPEIDKVRLKYRKGWWNAYIRKNKKA